MLQSALLRLVARNVQSIVDFMVALDARLDAFLEKHDGEVAKFEAKIEDIYAKNGEEVTALFTAADQKADILFKNADEAVAKIETKIDATKKSAEMARALKRSMPSAAPVEADAAVDAAEPA